MDILASFCVKFHRIRFPRFPVKREQKISTRDTDRHSEIQIEIWLVWSMIGYVKICQHFTNPSNVQMEYNFIRIDNKNCEANNNTLCKEHRCEVFLENNLGLVQGVG